MVFQLGDYMLLDQQIQQLFYDLIVNEKATVSLGQEDIFVRILDNAHKITLSTLVYSGDKFIPLAVRRCVMNNRPLPSGPWLKTYFNMDEDKYQVHLNYLGNVASFSQISFKELLEEFSDCAEEWRLILDEQDRNDLVHVHAQ